MPSATPLPTYPPFTVTPNTSADDASRTKYTPLGTAKGAAGSNPPQVTLPVPIGQVALNTAKDIEAARTAAQFDPTKIEETIRDGRIDNESRRKIIDTLDQDEMFGDWKKRM